MESTLSLNQLLNTRQYPTSRTLDRLTQIPDFREVISGSTLLFANHATELDAAVISVIQNFDTQKLRVNSYNVGLIGAILATS